MLDTPQIFKETARTVNFWKYGDNAMPLLNVPIGFIKVLVIVACVCFLTHPISS